MVRLRAFLAVLAIKFLLKDVIAAPRFAIIPPDEFLQPGADKTNCLGFREAISGDTCTSMALVSGIPLGRFLQINPQIGTAEDCSTKLLANYYYCVASKLNGDMFEYNHVPHLTEPARQDVPSPTYAPPPANEAPAPPARTTPFRASILDVLPTAAPEIAKPPADLKCEIAPNADDNQCYKSFAHYGPTASAQMSEWCKTFLWSEVSATNFNAWDPHSKIPDAPNWNLRAGCKNKYNGNPNAMSTFCWCIHDTKYPKPTWPATARFCPNPMVKPCLPPG